MKIRNAKVEDAAGVAEVLLKSYNINSIEEAKRAFINELKRGYRFIVAEEDNKIIGIVSWIIHGLPKHELAELDRIAVLPTYRGRGIGKALFNALIKEANEEYKKYGYRLRKLYLLTHASNKNAHEFYEKLGMKLEAVLKNHFYDNEDEYVYSKFF